ncbi:hypothetical protein AAZX31_14G105700 [Glycine max]
MSTRKYESGNSKLQKKRRVEALIALQKGAIDKFIKIDEKNELENTGGCSLNERDNNLDIGESNNKEVKKALLNKLANEDSKDWRNLSAKLKSHEITNEHITNMNAWIDLKMRLVKNKTIDKHVQEQINKDRELVKTLGKNNLAFRGKNEKIYQEANANILSLIEMIAEFDPIMQEHIRRIKDDEIHNHYLGHNIHNELINLLVGEIKIKIIKKIKDIYISHQEQMSFVLRYVDISSTPIQVNDGKGLFDAIIYKLKIVGLYINDLRGQGYDNGSNMKGKHQVLCDMGNYCPKSKSFFGVLQRVYTLFPSSNKRSKILQNHIHNLTLKSLSQTCWESCIESLKAVRFQTLQIRDVLFELAKASDDPKIKSEVDCLANYELENFEFLLGMTIWNLQSKSMCIDEAIEQLKGLLSFFEKYRENGFENALISTKEIAFEMDIEPKFREKHIKSFRIDYFLYIVDKAITTLQNLFSELNILKEIIGLENDKPIDILNYIKRIIYFPNAYIAYRIMSFSKLKIIKTYLRSTMSQQRLNGLALLSIEKKMPLKSLSRTYPASGGSDQCCYSCPNRKLMPSNRERQIALQLMGQGEMIDAIVEPIKENVDSDELGQNKIQTKNSELVEGSDPEKEGETSDKDDKVQIDLSSNESQCLEVS